MKAVWSGQVIAQSNHTVVEGNHYFPRDSVRPELLRPSETHTICPWKGEASYCSLEVDGQENRDAAWYDPSPKPAMANITDHIAFWRGVRIEG